MASDSRVGIIGANAASGWALDAHVPALKALPGMTLVAVAARSQQSADEAARAFGAAKAYGDGLALIADPEIDIVAVTTRVPDHRALVLAAIDAGKHVYGEWPLGRNVEETVEMTRAAEAAGVKTAVGLQLRGSPAVAQARALIASGALGRVLSMNILSTTAIFGPEIIPQYAYTEDPGTFANLVTIQGAHTLDLLLALGGEIDVLSAVASRQFPQVTVQGSGVARQRVIFDHLLAQGRFDGGVPFTMEVAGGRSKGTPFYLDIVGEKATLRLDGGSVRGLQAGRIGLLLDGERLRVDERPYGDLADGAINVAGVYSMLRDDIVNGTSTAIGFAHAIGLTGLIEGILASPNGALQHTGGG